MEINNLKDLDKYGVRTLFEWYNMKISSQTLEESRADPVTQLIQKEIESRLRDYEEDADKFGNKRKADRLIVGNKRRKKI